MDDETRWWLTTAAAFVAGSLQAYRVSIGEGAIPGMVATVAWSVVILGSAWQLRAVRS
jgi:hypothetical protein